MSHNMWINTLPILLYIVFQYHILFHFQVVELYVMDACLCTSNDQWLFIFLSYWVSSGMLIDMHCCDITMVTRNLQSLSLPLHHTAYCHISMSFQCFCTIHSPSPNMCDFYDSCCVKKYQFHHTGVHSCGLCNAFIICWRRVVSICGYTEYRASR